MPSRLAAGAQLPFSREHEITTPYYYSVELGAGRRGAPAPKSQQDMRVPANYFPAHSPMVVVEGHSAPGLRAHRPRSDEIVGYNPDRMDAI